MFERLRERRVDVDGIREQKANRITRDANPSLRDMEGITEAIGRLRALSLHLLCTSSILCSSVASLLLAAG